MERRKFIKTGFGALSSLAVGETILLTPTDAQAWFWSKPKKNEVYGQRKQVRRANGKGRLANDYSKAKIVKGVCLNCSTVCGIQGYVIDGRLVKVGGNPEDPNNGKSLCAKGQAGPLISTYADRLLFPLKRVGARGQGKWMRITWDEAHSAIADRMRKAIDEGKPEEIAIQIGRSRLAEEMGRFLNAVGSPSLFNHRALCSSNKRAANYVSLGETDWESGDFANSKYMIDFGANVYEAHQGAIHAAKRIINGRFDNGAKFVYFAVRMSNTAGRADEWFMPNPGSDGAIALAMGQAIIAANRHDRQWLDTWSNVKADDLKQWISQYTPEWAEQVSGVPAADIRRIAREFAAAAPAAVAFTNRGSGAHYNGFNNDRAVIMLNAIVGSIGRKGGYCYTVEPTRVPPLVFPQPMPRPPAPTAKSTIEDPPEWPLANKWQRMKVGQIVYQYYDLYAWELKPDELTDTRVDGNTRIIYRKSADGRESMVGLMAEGKARRGFLTPSRKFSIYHEDIEAAAKQTGFTEDGQGGMPAYFQIPTFQTMKSEHLHLATFKWNVHTQGRTQSQKYLSEIVHHNPMWINTETAARYGIKTGDMVELTTYRPSGHQMRNGGDLLGKALIPAWVTEGIHPRVLAVSNTLGNPWHGRAATGMNGPKQAIPAWDNSVNDEDADLDDDIWWDRARGGTGAGYNINAILPIQPSPLVGMQGWYDTICTLKKV